MPYWTRKELQHLRELWPKVKSPAALQSLSGILGRSMEAVAMKAKRMGLSVPNQEKHFAKNSEEKNSFFSTTTTPKLEPVKFEECWSPNEMLGLLMAAMQRLKEPDVSPAEIKKLRLIIQGAKAYIHLFSGVVWHIRHTESEFLSWWRTRENELKRELESAKSEEEKAEIKKDLEEVQAHVAELIELGTADPKKLREEMRL